MAFLTVYSEEEAIKNLLKYYFAMLLLERIQFMASFAITFTIAKTGLFQAIGQAVKKIAQDELEVHVEFRKQVILELQNNILKDS
jgi:ribonucleoside-diphosphate reductase beta chain